MQQPNVMTDEEYEADASKQFKAFLKTLSVHPFVESDDEYPIVMAMVFSEGRTFLGGVSSMLADDDLPIVMYAPLTVQEGMVRDPNTGEVHQQIALLPVSFLAGLMDVVSVKASMFYQLKAESKADQTTVREYEKKYRDLQAQSAGIVAPTGNDMANLTRSSFGSK